MARRLRILSIASTFPYPPIGGTRILVYRQVGELSRHHDVDLVAVDVGAESAFDRSGLPDCRSISIIPIRVAERHFSLGEKVAITAKSGYPFYIYQRYSAAAQRLVDERIATQRYDAIIAEDGEAGVYVRSVHPGLKVLSRHAILSVQREQLAQIAESTARRMLDRAYAGLARRYERNEADRFDLIKLPTRDDVTRWNTIVRRRRATAFALSNGVDLSYFEYRARTGPVDRLIFTANMAGPQNADAATWFIDHVYPKVVQAMGDIPLYVVGRDPSPQLRAKATDKIIVTGSVPDVRPFFGSKAIAVVPLRIASGIINKVLEPMAMGVGVVATSLAVAGLDIPGERVCMVADEPAEFAQRIAQLATDDALYTRLTTAAHDYVQASHAWPELLKAYRGRIEDAVHPRERVVAA